MSVSHHFITGAGVVNELVVKCFTTLSAVRSCSAALRENDAESSQISTAPPVKRVGSD